MVGRTLLLAALALPAGASDWPSVRGNAAMTGEASGKLTDRLALQWSFEAPGAIGSGIAIANGLVLFGDGTGILHALDANTGTERWRYDAKEAIEAPTSVAGDLVLVGDLAGVLHAVNLADGKPRWTFTTEAEIQGGVTVTDGCLLLGSYDATIRCLSRDGVERWKVETDNYVHAAAAATKSRAWVAGCDGFLRGIDLATGAERNKIALGGYVATSPAIAGKRAVVGTFENEIVAVDLETGTVAWRFSDPERSFPFASSAATDGTLVWIGGRDRRVHALELGTGKPRWTWNAGSKVDASPVLVGDRLVVATERGRLALLDATTGREVGVVEVGGMVTTSPAVADGRVVVGTADGLVSSFGAPR